MAVIHRCEQRSPEWYALRAGRLTGSCAADILAEGKKKGSESIMRRDLRFKLALERLTGRSLESEYLSMDMRRGIEHEHRGLAAYEAFTGTLLRKVGFIAHETIPVGCSLDGAVGTEGIVEVKCPKPAIHYSYLKSREVPTEYIPQITHNLWVSDAKWCDFISYNAQLPPPFLHLFVVRVERDEESIIKYATAAAIFLSEVFALYEELKAAKPREVIQL